MVEAQAMLAVHTVAGQMLGRWPHPACGLTLWMLPRLLVLETEAPFLPFSSQPGLGFPRLTLTPTATVGRGEGSSGRQTGCVA